MSDLIDRLALRRAMYHEAMEKDSDEQKWDSGCWIRYKMFERVLDSMPSAQPEVIRCKDCKYHGANECNHSCALVVSKDNDFCSYAERRMKGEEE